MTKKELYIFTDSHGSDDHYFPDQFKPLFERSKRFKEPVIKDHPGCEMNKKKVKEICQTATSIEPLAQVIVVFMGGNNHRRKPRNRNQTRQSRPQYVLKFYKDILDHCQTISNCRVVFCTLIPGIGHDQNSKEEFKTMNDLLNELCLSEEYNSFASFCKFTRKLCINGRLNEELYEDRVHLTEAGSQIVAIAIHSHLHGLPK